LYKLPKEDKKASDNEGNDKAVPEKPVECKLKGGFKPWPMCPQGSLPVNGMNGDNINRVKDGPFLGKNETKAAKAAPAVAPAAV